MLQYNKDNFFIHVINNLFLTEAERKIPKNYTKFLNVQNQSKALSFYSGLYLNIIYKFGILTWLIFSKYKDIDSKSILKSFLGLIIENTLFEKKGCRFK